MTRERAGPDRGAGSGPEAKVVTGRLHRAQRGRRKRFESAPPPPPERRPARVALQLALAHEVQRAIDRGELKDQADAARRLGLTRARLTQLLDLTLLAPDIEERVLLLEAVNGVEPITERGLRHVPRARIWQEQLARFVLVSHGGKEPEGQ
ncbi:MAG: hypothetical protein EDX89_22930 [Acidobacteria bacterium]|nr:MAG: hypothetical protein EDX89_22930 [Acidobacteriota bacterium]